MTEINVFDSAICLNRNVQKRELNQYFVSCLIKCVYIRYFHNPTDVVYIFRTVYL